MKSNVTKNIALLSSIPKDFDMSFCTNTCKFITNAGEKLGYLGSEFFSIPNGCERVILGPIQTVNRLRMRDWRESKQPTTIRWSQFR